jgi:hypothetical protein
MADASLPVIIRHWWLLPEFWKIPPGGVSMVFQSVFLNYEQNNLIIVLCTNTNYISDMCGTLLLIRWSHSAFAIPSV